MPDFERWLTALQSPDEAERLEAIQHLAVGSITAAGPQLIALLDDPSAEVRAAAATALVQINLSGEALQQAITALMLARDDSDASVRQAINAALIELEQLVEIDADASFELEEASDEAEKPAAKVQRASSKPAEAPVPVEDGLFGGVGAAVSDYLASTAGDVDTAIEVPVLPMSPSPFAPPAETGALPPPPVPAAAPVPQAPPAAAPGASGAPAQPAPAPTRDRQSETASLEQQALQQEAQEVQFSAYFPREIVPARWFPLTAYLFKSFAAEQVLADARSTLGAWMAAVRRVISNVRRTLPEGTVVTATPYMEGVQFNPSSITVGFYEDWHRLDFRLRTTDAPLYQAVNGRLTFTVEGVIIADVPLSIYVIDTVTGMPDISSLTSDQPTSSASGNSGMQTVSQKLYKSIFCSYSHDDKAIVERVERVYKALGFDFLRDVVSLKSGEDWDSKLYALIEQADIFQLFWSSTAAQSEYVEREWRHALSLDRDETNFIRPVYWQQPMPPVPTELGDIHFAYEPTLDDNL
jgi:hypothetical protein